MTDEEIRNGFDKVYNDFWRRHRDLCPALDSAQWDAICQRAEELMKEYAFLKETIAELTVELDRRARIKKCKNP